MRILCVGPESSGTRLMTTILRATGAEVSHSSPAYKPSLGGVKYSPYEYDAVVLVIRNGSWNVRSMQNRKRFRNTYESPQRQIMLDIWDVLRDLAHDHINVHIVTYESLVYETEHCLRALCQDLDLPAPVGYDEVQNGNEKFWADDAWAGDDRPLHER